MSQNNMISFITVTDIHGSKIELNPAIIGYMVRHETNMVPSTKIVLAGSYQSLHVTETPEQIAQLQIDAIAKTITVLMPEMIEGFDDIFEE